MKINDITRNCLTICGANDANAFKSGRHFAAWIGLVPRRSIKYEEVYLRTYDSVSEASRNRLCHAAGKGQSGVDAVSADGHLTRARLSIPQRPRIDPRANVEVAPNKPVLEQEALARFEGGHKLIIQ